MWLSSALVLLTLTCASAKDGGRLRSLRATHTQDVDHRSLQVGPPCPVPENDTVPTTDGRLAKLRYPSVPLIVNDPDFSIWSNYNKLTDGFPSHWSGYELPMVGLVRIDGQLFRFLGRNMLERGPWPAGHHQPDMDVPALTQTQLIVWPTRTEYTFAGRGIALSVTFATPASIMEDFDAYVSAPPVTYMTVDVESTDDRAHDVQLLYQTTGHVGVTGGDEHVAIALNAPAVEGHDVLTVGNFHQVELGLKGDGMTPNHGFFHLVTPKDNGTVPFTSTLFDTHGSIDDNGAPAGNASMEELFLSDQFRRGNSQRTTWRAAIDAFTDPEFTADKFAALVSKVTEPTNQQYRNDGPARNAALGLMMDLGSVAPGESATRRVLFAFDDRITVNFFGRLMQPAWRNVYRMEEGMPLVGAFDNKWHSSHPTGEMLKDAMAKWDDEQKRSIAFDEGLVDDLFMTGGPKYAAVASLVYRQVTGGQKVVHDDYINEHRVFQKEISTNGMLNTVDVIFPTSPMLLLFSPEVLRLMLVPILDYSANKTLSHYRKPWAPHHLGIWPVADTPDYRNWDMPMEETADMLILIAAIAHRQGGNVSYLADYWPVIDQWGSYLNESLPNPPHQLYTDDFKGPDANATNLALKGTFGLAAYADLLAMNQSCWTEETCGNSTIDGARAAATRSASYWVEAAMDSPAGEGEDGGEAAFFRRLFDAPSNSTFSLKYNLIWQAILQQGRDNMNITGVTASESTTSTSTPPLFMLFSEDVFTTEMMSYINLGRLDRCGVALDERNNLSLYEYQGVTVALAQQYLLGMEGGEVMMCRFVDALYNFPNETPQRVPLADYFEVSAPCNRRGLIDIPPPATNDAHFIARPTLGYLYAPLLLKRGE
ncbi:unnamed protein product [Vitrella brassicaformis CCMP3155]|uniref:Glutaminase n=1 Tax=Vitrella brassicaformis (strain CCMP3155) TaxID=1169540 RepID=A0A0G4EFN4_VITBC|nr:unnamed protein product [Vitrella brassicaformis CCMP3155]|eukprot:CEL95225.1 unnamed protein product [Vitrella brassicaformis CCMP3155]